MEKLLMTCHCLLCSKPCPHHKTYHDENYQKVLDLQKGLDSRPKVFFVWGSTGVCAKALLLPPPRNKAPSIAQRYKGCPSGRPVDPQWPNVHPPPSPPLLSDSPPRPRPLVPPPQFKEDKWRLGH